MSDVLPRDARALSGVRLYARSRAVPGTLVLLAGTAVLALWAAARTGSGPDPDRLLPVVTLVPPVAAAVIGTSLYSASDELDRTAVRPWWPRRLAQLLGLTAVAAAVLPLAVLGDAPAVLRNVLGCTGLTAASACLLGARLSWLPACGYVSAVYLASDGAHGRAVTVWAWPTQPGHVSAAWVMATGAFVLGTALYAARGARSEGIRG
ncbi:hypothetical protein [Streptomyces sp. NPDC096132]|uniref:hypothetical protein n=1 Tax=Streptomyces sp. NPDC096132 TaxID=3366075 RepID=UPI003817801E